MAGSIIRLRAAATAVGCRQFASSAWLMLPSNAMYSPAEKKVVNIKKESESESGQVVGSSRGWVGLYDKSSSSVSVWNPMSGDHIKLPPLHSIPIPGYCVDLSVRKLIVGDAECSRVVIVGPSSMCLGECSPNRCSEWILFHNRQIEDVVSCSQRKFYSIDDDGDELVRWNISESWRPRIDEWRSSLSELGYVLHPDDDDIKNRFPRKPNRDCCYSSPHLVYAEHSDQLFLVTRHYIQTTDRGGAGVSGLKYCFVCPYMTVGFDVHLVEVVESSGRGKLRYMKHSLDGLVMFVGLNDSFAVPAADFPHLKPDSIYYTDHHQQTQYIHPQQFLFKGHDVGIYDYKNEVVSSCYFPVDHHCFKRTDNPLPFWFTPTSTK